jgi:hypothetical protein
MISGVVAKFCPRKPLQPIPRSVTRQATEVHAKRLVDGLALAIRLRVKSSAHLELNTREAKKIAPHMPSENRIAITDDGVEEAMETNDVVEEGAE